MANARQFLAARTGAWAKGSTPAPLPKIYLYSYGFVGEPVPETPEFVGVSSVDLSYTYDSYGNFSFDSTLPGNFSVETTGSLKEFIESCFGDSKNFSTSGFDASISFSDKEVLIVAGDFTSFLGEMTPPYLCFYDWSYMIGGKIMRCLVFDHRIDQ